MSNTLPNSPTDKTTAQTHIAVIGMGYVGIPAAALFADVPGFTVTGIQRRSKRSGWKIDALNRGENPIGGDEPGYFGFQKIRQVFYTAQRS